MESLPSNFAKHLKHPFVLIGFVIMLIFGVYDKLIEKGIIQPLPPDQINIVVQLILAYGFWLGMLVVVLAFVWQVYKTHTDTKIKKKDHIESKQQAQQTAQAYRNLGALAFLDNTQEALQAYRQATQLDPDNADGWNQLGHLLDRIGDLDEAITAYNTVLTLGKQHGDNQEIVAAYGNLGIAYQTRGDLDKAIEFHQKALTLFEALDNKEGMANAYGNLGDVYQTRGDLDKAIEFHQKTLTLDEALGNKEGMAIANQYGNLGNVYYTRGDLDKAIEFHQKALTLFEALGSKESMAVAYGNLGMVYQMRGDLDKAIEFHQKALTFNEALGRKEGIANTYGNLGIIYEHKGNKTEAKRYYVMSLDLLKKLGSPNVQTVQRRLESLEKPSSTLDHIDQMKQLYGNTHLDELFKKFKREDIKDNFTLEWFEKEFGIDYFEHSKNYEIGRWENKVFTNVLESLKIAGYKFSNYYIYVLPLSKEPAFSYCYNEDNIIVLNTDISFKMLQFAASFHYIIKTIVNETIKGNKKPTDHMNLTTYFFNHLYKFFKTDHYPLCEKIQCDHESFTQGHHIKDAMLTFLLLHEFSHGYLNHVRECKSIIKDGNIDYFEIRLSNKRELEADKLAVDLYFELNKHHNGFYVFKGLSNVWYAPLLLFYFLIYWDAPKIQNDDLEEYMLRQHPMPLARSIEIENHLIELAKSNGVDIDHRMDIISFVWDFIRLYIAFVIEQENK